jgi:hypothetical protein
MTPTQEQTPEQQARDFAMGNLMYPMISGLASTKLAGEKYTDQRIKDLVQTHVYTPSFSREGDPAGLIYNWLEQGFDAEGQPAINREYLMNKAVEIMGEYFEEITVEDYMKLLGVNSDDLSIKDNLAGRYIKDLSSSESAEDKQLSQDLKSAYEANMVDLSVMKALGSNRQFETAGILEKIVKPTAENGLAGVAQA